MRETARHMYVAAKDARKKLETAVKLIEQNLDASASQTTGPSCRSSRGPGVARL